MPAKPSDCNPCPPWPLRELLYFPPGGGGPPSLACFLVQEDGSEILLENLTGSLLLETCP